MVIILEQLAGRTFKGFFQRDPYEIAKELQEIKEGKYQIPITESNDKYDFEMHIFDYNPESGLFVARGNDKFGSSGIVGVFYFEPKFPQVGAIKFNKTYVQDREVSPGISHSRQGRIDSYKNFRIIEYVGEIERDADHMNMSGEYHIIGNNKRLNGIWDLRASQKPV